MLLSMQRYSRVGNSTFFHILKHRIWFFFIFLFSSGSASACASWAARCLQPSLPHSSHHVLVCWSVVQQTPPQAPSLLTTNTLFAQHVSWGEAQPWWMQCQPWQEQGGGQGRWTGAASVGRWCMNSNRLWAPTSAFPKLLPSTASVFCTFFTFHQVLDSMCGACTSSCVLPYKKHLFLRWLDVF